MRILKNNISTTQVSVGYSKPTSESTPTLTGTGTLELADLNILFSKISCVLLNDNLTENGTLATWANPDIRRTGLALDGSAGQVMVKIPRVYYQELYDGTGTLIGVDISEYPKAGYSLHPKFAYANKDYLYVSAYEAGDDGGTKLKSVSGVAPLVNINLEIFRTRAEARGAGWFQYDFWTHHLLTILAYVYYRTYDIQTALPGYTDASSYKDSYKRNTGRSNILTTACGYVPVDLAGVDSDLTGTLASGKAIANRFFWIENIYGHIWKITDGFAADGRTSSTNKVYVTPNPSKFSYVEATILANYDDLGILLPGGQNETYIQYLQKGMLPKTQGGGGTTYVTDYFWSYLNDGARDFLRLGFVGARLAGGSVGGLSSRLVNSGLGYASPTVGSRLCAIK